MADIIKIKRGLKENIPQLEEGELGYCTDTNELYIGTSVGNNVKISPDCVNVKRFGAVGDGVHDDTEAIQAAIDYFLDNNGALYFPGGIYNISKPLECYKNGKYVVIYGDGKRESIINATKNMPYMIKLWNDEETTYFTISMKNIGFQMNEYADIGIEAWKTPYSIFDSISIFSSKENSILLRISSWCNRVVNCTLYGNYGYVNSDGLTIRPVTGIQVKENLSTNNLIIQDNVFGILKNAIEILSYVNDMHILKNTFDNCGRIIVAEYGTNNLTFHYNYCEACGGTQEIQYTEYPIEYKKGNYTRQLLSPFIFHEHLLMGIHYKITASIKYNMFANCYPERLVAVSNIKHLEFSNNTFYRIEDTDNPTQYYNNIIYLFGVGIYDVSSLLFIENRYKSIENLIEYDTYLEGYYYCKGEIKIYNSYGTSNFNISPIYSHNEIKLNNEDVTDFQNIIVNNNNMLKVSYKLSKFDLSHPHMIYIYYENINANNILIDLTGIDSNEERTALYYQRSFDINNNPLIFPSLSDRYDFKFNSMLLQIKADGDLKINNIYAIVANGDNHFIQLV